MEPATLDLSDIQKAAWLMLNHIEPVLVKGRDGRVLFRVQADQKVSMLLMDYERNPEVRLLDYVRNLKVARGRMLDMRDGRSGNGFGNGTRGDVDGNRRP